MQHKKRGLAAEIFWACSPLQMSLKYLTYLNPNSSKKYIYILINYSSYTNKTVLVRHLQSKRKNKYLVPSLQNI